MAVLRLSVLIVVAALLAAACGPAAPTPEPVALAIDMAEFKFQPAALQLQVGQQVQLDLTNSGQLPHEIMIGRDVRLMNDGEADPQPAGYENDLFHSAGVTPKVTVIEPGRAVETEAAHGADHGDGFMVVVNPGGRSQVTFIVTEVMIGEWEIGCFEQEGVHYTAGMKGPLTISQ